VFDDIDPRSPTPLYEQIAARVRVAVAAGDLNPGDPLPSVRALARQLRINPATVVQAYRGLAIDGFVELRHGQGTFIQEVAQYLRDEEKEAQATELVRKVIQEAARRGVSVADLAQAFTREAGVEIRE
jgi:DNA-binding transcriptional regulator YhcF (GntR family)